MAQTCTWIGDSSANWSDANNWHGTVSDHTKPVSGDSVVFNAASTNCTLNESSATLASLDFTSGGASNYAATFTHSGGHIYCSGNITFSATMTYTIGTTYYIQFSGAGNKTLTTNTMLMTHIYWNASTVLTFGDNIAFGANKTHFITLGGGSIDCNGKTISGNSSSNRLIIASTTLGTQRTITNALSTTFDNCDFKDISFTTGGALDLTNGATKLIGDCGGNSATGGALTFTTADDKFWVGGTGSWSDDDNHWALSSGGAAGDGNIPLPQDTCYFDNSSDSGNFTITCDMPRLGKTIDTSGYTDASTFTLNINSITNTVYGSVDFSQVDTIGASTTYPLTFESMDRSGTYTFNAGQTLQAVAIQAVGGTLNLAANLTLGSGAGRDVTVNNGTFDLNGYNLTGAALISSNSNLRTINLGSGNFTGNLVPSTVFINFSTSTNLTFNAGTSTIYTPRGSTYIQTGNQTFNNFVIIGPGTNEQYSRLYFIGDITLNNLTSRPNSAVNLKRIAFAKGGIVRINGNFNPDYCLFYSDLSGSNIRGIWYLIIKGNFQAAGCAFQNCNCVIPKIAYGNTDLGANLGLLFQPMWARYTAAAPTGNYNMMCTTIIEG